MARLLILLVASLVLTGCGSTADEPGGKAASNPPQASEEERLPEDEQGNFTLYVSNQSFDIDPVDIRVEIDGKLAVDDTFAVEDQHNWVEFVFRLPAGEHVLTAESRDGDAILERRFTVAKRHWAVVEYWYYPGERKHLSFEIYDEPIGFA